jgi:pimeloyl-ACP methyl ester carboxylesterase
VSSLGLVLLAASGAGLIAGMLYQRVGSRRDARRLPPPGRLIGADRRRLHLYCLGDGPLSVIFESGLAASSLSWRPIQEEVARFARACAYDRSGYGWSPRASGSRSARVAAADLNRLLQAAGVPPPYVFVAHSFGSYIAQVFAADHPAKVAGLVLVDPITPDEWITPGPTERRLLMGGRLFSWLGAALASVGVVRFLLNRTHEGGSSLPGAVLRLFGREADAVVRRVVGEVTKMPRDLWPAVRAHWSRPAAFLTMAQHFRALPRSAQEVQAALFPSGEACPLRELPIAIVSAANAPDHRVRGQRLLAELSRRGAHVRATMGGHWVHLDDPAAVIGAIRAVLESGAR